MKDALFTVKAVGRALLLFARKDFMDYTDKRILFWQEENDMRFFPTGAESAAIDKCTIEEIGIPQLVLMERAALTLAEETVKLADNKSKILAICEGGNNGGDGIAAARILHEWGYQADVFYIGGIKRTTEAFEKQKEIALKCGVRFVSSLSEMISGYDIVIDAVFGVGLSREVAGVQAEVISAINKAKEEKPEIIVVAADIPSGISTESGTVLGTAVKADVTVTFGFTKLGMLFGEGRECSGRIITRDIGFSKDIKAGCYGLDMDDIRKMLPVRSANANKGSFGRLLLVAGNSEISGAAVIAGQAAFKVGTGLVKILTDKANRDIIGAALPEVLLRTYDPSEIMVDTKVSSEAKNSCAREVEDSSSTISDADVFAEMIKKEVSWATAVAIGPGLGTDEKAVKLLKTVLLAAAEYDKPVVMDADAINIISLDREFLKSLNKHCINDKQTEEIKECEISENVKGCEISDSSESCVNKRMIITPHMLEMARLVRDTEAGEDVRVALERIKKDRFTIAKSVSNEYNVISVLKDARTVISDGTEGFCVNTTGNSGMAKGGSGDSLTGIIGGLLAQGLKPYDAARAGVYIHGAAGDMAAERFGHVGMTATELNLFIKDVLG